MEKEKSQNRESTLSIGKCIFCFALLLTLIYNVSAFTISIDAGDCYNFTYIEEVYNNETNQTTYENATAEFCADGTTNFCSINETLELGEHFTRTSGACDIDIKVEEDYATFEHDIPIDITADMDYIRVTVGTDTKSYPRESEGFSYSMTETAMCPTAGFNGTSSDTPESIVKCLDVLFNEQNENDQCPENLLKCQADRDNFKVEWETRGRQVEDLDTKIGGYQVNLDNCKDDVASSSTSNWLLLILNLILVTCVVIFIAIKFKRGRSSSLIK